MKSPGEHFLQAAVESKTQASNLLDILKTLVFLHTGGYYFNYVVAWQKTFHGESLTFSNTNVWKVQTLLNWNVFLKNVFQA